MKTKTLILAVAVGLALSLSNQSEAQQLTIRPLPSYLITVESVPGTSYTIQGSTNIADPASWQNLVNVSGNGRGFYTYTNFQGSNQQMSYRTVQADSSNPNFAQLALDGASPNLGSVPVSNPTLGQYLGLYTHVFKVTSPTNGHLHTVVANLNRSGNGTVNAVYLYQGVGQNLIPLASASVDSNGIAVFSNLDGQAGSSIPANTPTVFSIKADVSGLTQGSEAVEIHMNPADITLLDDSSDSVIPITGTAYGYTINVIASGPMFSLSDTPSITKENITSGGATVPTYQYTATFNVNVVALGENIGLGVPFAPIPAFGSATTGTNNAQLLVNGVPVANNGCCQIIAAYSVPPSTIQSSDGMHFILAENQSITIPVTYSWVVKSPGANVYGIKLTGINWTTGSGQERATTFDNWITSSI